MAGVASYLQVTRAGGPVPLGSRLRTAGSITCYTAEMVGALILFLGAAWGLYVIAVPMVANFFFMISGSWLLLVGVSHDEARR